MTDREALARSVLELERDVMLAAQKVKIYDNSIMHLNRNKAKSSVTIKELDRLGQDHRTYRPLGRGFIMKPKKEIEEELQTVIKSNDKDIAEFQKQKEFYYKKTMDLEKKMNEAIQKYQASK